MKIPIWIPPNHLSWWRIHPNWWKDDIGKISEREFAVECANEIVNNHKNELELQKINGFISTKNSYWRDPFPPYYT